jgi:hypothetical protein
MAMPQASFAEDTVTVGGAPMYPSKTIVENAVNSRDHTTLVVAVKGSRSRTELIRAAGVADRTSPDRDHGCGDRAAGADGAIFCGAQNRCLAHSRP